MYGLIHFTIKLPLQWHHNEDDGVSNHQPHDCLFKHLFRQRSKKTSKLRVTGLCAGNSPVTSEFPAQMASNAENVSIWWRHHDYPPHRLGAVHIAGRYNRREILHTCHLRPDKTTTSHVRRSCKHDLTSQPIKMRMFLISSLGTHDEVINWKHFRVTGLSVGNSPVTCDFPQRGQWRGDLMFSFICAWINDSVNNRDAGDLRRHLAHYDVIVMRYDSPSQAIKILMLGTKAYFVQNIYNILRLELTIIDIVKNLHRPKHSNYFWTKAYVHQLSFSIPVSWCLFTYIPIFLFVFSTLCFWLNELRFLHS